MNYELST